MKKVIITSVMLLIILWPFCANADDDSKKNTQDPYNSELNYLDTREIEKYIEDLNRETSDYIPPINFKSFISIFKSGGNGYNVKDMVNGVLKFFIRDVLLNMNLLLKLIVLAIISALLQNLEKAFDNDNVSNIAYYACYLVIIIIVSKSFASAINIGKETITKMSDFMIALFPALITLLTSVGGITSATVFDPLIMGGVQVVSLIVRDFILPLIFLTAILSLVNNLSDTLQLSKLTDLLKQICKWSLGLIVTIFVGVVTIRGAASQTLDQVAVKTAKFAVDNFVPVVGKALSDAVSTIASYSLLLKDAVSTIGLITLVISCVFPLLKIVSLIFIYKVSSALVEPVCDKRIVGCLNEVGNTLTLVFASVLAVAVMFFIMVTIMASAGKLAVMGR